MNVALQRARGYGIAVVFADLGAWGEAELRSEYDPTGPTIRINTRVAKRLTPDALGEFVTLAVGHELYHHRERLGEIARVDDRREREAAADAFARELRDTP